MGVSRKDVTSYRIKNKGAFYNCFVVILRVQVRGEYKEFHVKIFNTGKIEIPGIQDDRDLPLIIQVLLTNLRLVSPIEYVIGSEEIVLINSNFNCNFYINRDRLYSKLMYTHGISSVYDPCSYPGIQCKFFFLSDGTLQPVASSLTQSISVMIFRTGSILIVGKCTEPVLHSVYAKLNELLRLEYDSIVEVKGRVVARKVAKVKAFRKIIWIQ